MPERLYASAAQAPGPHARRLETTGMGSRCRLRVLALAAGNFPTQQTHYMWENFPCQVRLCHNAPDMDEISEEQAPVGEGLNVSPALVQALRRLLRPVVRLLLARHITYPYLIQLLKSLFVEVAVQEFPLAGKRQTDSRISLLTGVHRKDVRRLLDESRESVALPPANVSFGVRLITRWSREPAYLDEAGLPRPLPRLGQVDGSPSFERLVAEESKDIRARAVLDEWLRLGLVSLADDDRVHLRQRAFVPEHGFDEKVYFLGRNGHDHLAAATHNVLDGQPPFLERSVFAGGLSAEAIGELAVIAEQTGMDALWALGKRARELRQQAPAEGTPRRMTFGLYFYSEEQVPDAPAAEDER